MFKIIENGQARAIPEDLSDYHEHTYSDVERADAIIEIVKSELNKALLWKDPLSSNARDSHGREYFEEVLPIKTTQTFRLSPGEKARVANRLEAMSRSSYSASSWNVRGMTNDEIQLLNAYSTPNTVINSFKTYRSRNYRENVFSENMNYNSDIFNRNFEHFKDWWIERAIEYIAFEESGNRSRFNDSGWQMFDHNGDRLERSNYHLQKYQRINVAANFFAILQDALKYRREMVIDTADINPDNPELREKCEGFIQSILHANRVMPETINITDAQIVKRNRRIGLAIKVIDSKSKAIIRHPSGDTNNYPDYETDIKTFDGESVWHIHRMFKHLDDTSGANVKIGTVVSPNHPTFYVSSNELGGLTEDITDSMLNNSQFNHSNSGYCTGDYASTLRIEYARNNFITLMYSLEQWTSVYSATNTNPLRHPRGVLFGVKETAPEWYNDLTDISTQTCRHLFLWATGNEGNSLQDYLDSDFDEEDVVNAEVSSFMEHHCVSCKFKDDCVNVNDFHNATGIQLSDFIPNQEHVEEVTEEAEVDMSRKQELIKELVKGWYHAETS